MKEKSSNLFFAGMKHSGKTALGKIVAPPLGCLWLDSDRLLSLSLGVDDLRSYYKAKGEKAFREAEAEAIENFTRGCDGMQPYIISLGGGAADNERVLDAASSSGKIVYLYRTEEDVYPKATEDGIPAFLDPDDPRGSFKKIYERRDRIYRERADLVIDLGPYGDMAQTAGKIIRSIRRAGYAG